MGLQSIPFTAIVEYSRIYELDDVEEFAYLIRLMDNTFIEFYLAEQERRGNNNASGNADKTNLDKR